MPKKIVTTGNKAVAYGAMLARPKVIPAFPITPQTTIIEYLAELVDRGELKALFIPVESEMSAEAMSNGASRTGVRVFTATSANGALLMAEQMYSAGLRRLPIVMANVNRTVGPSWNILRSHEDSLILRDWPWLQFYVSTAQEALDTIIQAYKVAEKVRLPIMVCLDGFFLSHSSELVEIPDQEIVDQYLGEYNPEFKLDPENPHVFEPSIDDAYTTEFRYNLMEDLKSAVSIVKEADEEFAKLFGRSYGLVEKYNFSEETKIALVAIGTNVGTIRAAIAGQKDVGLLKIRTFRPLPKNEIFEALKNIESIAVLDGDMQGILEQEVMSVFPRPGLKSFITGLGGRDVTPETIKDIIREAPKPGQSTVWIDLKKIDTAKPFDIKEYPKPEIVLSKRGMRPEIPAEEFISPGHNACQGCGGVLALRYILKGLGKDMAMSLPACCWSVVNGRFPNSSILVPLQNVCFEVAAAEAAGIKAGFIMLGKDHIKVLAFAGDGGTYDIGLQALSGAAERNDDIIFICYNNEAYMNTGIQRSGATPFGSCTTTTPTMKPQRRKDMMAIIAAHRIPYAATASIAFPEDLIRKVKKSASIKGCKYIDVFSSCPPGWRHDPRISVKVARLAVASRVWPLYEIEGGEKYTINEMPLKIPVEKYLKLQGRFMNLTPELIEKIQKDTDKDLQRLEKLSKFFE